MAEHRCGRRGRPGWPVRQPQLATDDLGDHVLGRVDDRREDLEGVRGGDGDGHRAVCIGSAAGTATRMLRRSGRRRGTRASCRAGFRDPGLRSLPRTRCCGRLPCGRRAGCRRGVHSRRGVHCRRGVLSQVSAASAASPVAAVGTACDDYAGAYAEWLSARDQLDDAVTGRATAAAALAQADAQTLAALATFLG